MKFVIAQGKRKRELVGPFGICASREDFTNLRDQINVWLNDPGNGLGIAYGFLFVQERVVEFGPEGTKPEPWDD